MNDLSKNDPYDLEWTMDPHGAKDFLITDDAGKMHVGGCLPRSNKVGAVVPLLDTAKVPLLLESAWTEQESIRDCERRDINQNGYPACCLASLANAMEFAAVRDGRPSRPLDWLAAWRKLSGGRGGVALDDAAAFAMATGFPLADGSGVVKILEAWDCDTIEGFASALQRGCVGTFGHDVHAECATRMVKQNGVWMLDVRNSWGKDWGDKGWHLFPLRDIEPRYSWIAIRELAFTDDMGEWGDAT
jgi:hypothetical protein